MSSIESLRQAISTPEYYHFYLTKGMLIGCSGDVQSLLLEAGRDDKELNKPYVRLRKFYSLDVESEILLQEDNFKANENLDRIVSIIAQKEDKTVEQVQDIIQKALEGGLTLASLPIDWAGYQQGLVETISAAMGASTRKEQLAKHVLETRLGIEAEFTDKTKLSAPLVEALNEQFIIPEQNAWETAIATMPAEAEGNADYSKLENEIKRLTTIVSGLTSRVGKLETTDIEATPILSDSQPG